MLTTTTWLFFGLHAFAAAYTYFRNPTKIDKELVSQHHEICMMLALVALAILYR